MSGKLSLVFSLIALALVSVLVISCGSSFKPPVQPCTGGPYNIVGTWQITVNDAGGGSINGFGAIDSSGLALFFDNSAPNNSGDTIEMPTLTGACSFSGNTTAYPEPGGPNSGLVVTAATIGNVNSSSSISGTFTGTPGNPSGTISLTPFAPLTGSPAPFSGSFFGQAQGAINLQGVLVSVVFAPTGTGAGMTFGSPNNVGCMVNGSFTEQSTTNVFDVSMTFSAGCAFTGTVTGIGFESDSDYFNFNGGAAGTYLYADMLNSSNTFVMEFF